MPYKAYYSRGPAAPTFAIGINSVGHRDSLTLNDPAFQPVQANTSSTTTNYRLRLCGRGQPASSGFCRRGRLKRDLKNSRCFKFPRHAGGRWLSLKMGGRQHPRDNGRHHTELPTVTASKIGHRRPLAAADKLLLRAYHCWKKTIILHFKFGSNHADYGPPVTKPSTWRESQITPALGESFKFHGDLRDEKAVAVMRGFSFGSRSQSELSMSH
ncbi:hypothetical protein K438DRAFT_1751053 [Mycena galopus ATCC 62051]|nr:hypothetical protein K438DRAFT_1751053 [Mycena galopus ATCC 62051]